VIVSSSHHSSSASSPSKGESKGLVFVAIEGVATFGWLGCTVVVLVDIVKWRVPICRFAIESTMELSPRKYDRYFAESRCSSKCEKLKGLVEIPCGLLIAPSLRRSRFQTCGRNDLMSRKLIVRPSMRMMRLHPVVEEK
jgi:hypothetical protein